MMNCSTRFCAAGLMKPEFSIVIPTRNSVGIIDRLIEAILNQDFPRPFELIFLVTESRDGTENHLKKIPYEKKKIVHIPETEFSHSRTRMKGVELAEGSYVIFFTEDIQPLGKDFLYHLTQPVFQHAVPAVYATYQTDPTRADPVMAYLNNDWYRNFPDVTGPVSQSEWEALTPPERRHRCNFDDCASCIRKDLILELGFPDVPYGEDMFFAKRLLLNGHGIALAKKARFYHWHRMSFGYCLRRMCLDQHLSLEAFNLVYVKNAPSLLWNIVTRSIHRLAISLFVLPIPFFRKLYWGGYQAKIVTAEFLGKYIGQLDDKEENKSFNPLNRRLFRLKVRFLQDIGRHSIPRD